MLHAKLKIGKNKVINLIPYFFGFLILYIWLAWDVLRSIYDMVTNFIFKLNNLFL